MSLKSLCALALLLLAACEGDGKGARSDDAKSPSAVAQPVPQVSVGNQQGPLAASLSGPEQPRAGAPLLLTLRVDRRVLHDSLNVAVQVNLPDGVVLTRGEKSSELPPSDEQVATLEYVVRASALPDAPAVFVIDATAEGFGYHAELAYRFGRPAEMPQELPRGPDDVRVSSRNFGAPVEITPEP